MILTEKNGLRILTPKSSRYIINIKGTDIYTEKIYLGKNATLDDYEEIDKLTLEGYEMYDILSEEINELASKVEDINSFFAEVQSIINE